jgi:Ca2+-binding RTX toxin-like protein
MLNGGMGRDRLTGDDAGQFGNDTFVMRPGYGADTVTDFQRGYDQIDLRACGITHLGSDGVLAVGPTSNATWFLGGLDYNERLVFDPYRPHAVPGHRGLFQRRRGKLCLERDSHRHAAGR